MNDLKEKSASDIGDAAWAYNRWPTVGLFTGGCLSALLGLIFPVGWLWVVGFLVIGSIVGGFLGYLSARIIYGKAYIERRDNEDDASKTV